MKKIKPAEPEPKCTCRVCYSLDSPQHPTRFFDDPACPVHGTPAEVEEWELVEGKGGYSAGTRFKVRRVR